MSRLSASLGDFNYRGLRDESEQAYFPIFEGNDAAGNFYLKVRGTPQDTFQSIRTIIHNADPALPITYFRTLGEQVDRSFNTERMLATLSGSFGMLALLLSLVGLYGVMSFVVTQRRHEIGIRIALGATGRSAMWLLLRDAIAMIIAGHSYRGAVRRGARSAGGVSVVRRNCDRSGRLNRLFATTSRSVDSGTGRGCLANRLLAMLRDAASIEPCFDQDRRPK